MFCPNCGRPLNEGEICECQKQAAYNQPQQDNFSQAPNNTYANQPQQNNPYGQGYPQPQNFNTPPENSPPPYALGNEPATPAISVLRANGSSVLMLLICIISSASVVLSLLTSYTITQVLTNVTKLQSSYFTNIGLDPSFISPALTVASVASLLPTIIVLIGFWMFYFACKSPKDSLVKTGGITVLKVMVIIKNIGVILLAALYVLFGFIGGTVFAVNGDIPEGTNFVYYIIGAIALVIMGIAIALVVLKYKTLNAISSTASTGAANTGISMVVIVIYFLVGIQGALGSLSLFGMSTMFTELLGYSPLSMGSYVLMSLSALALAVPNILIGILLNKYRKEITAVAMSTVYPAPAVNVPYQPYSQPVQNQPYGDYYSGNGQPMQGQSYGQQTASGQQPVSGQQTVCPNCGTLYDSSAIRCPNCGSVNMNRTNM